MAAGLAALAIVAATSFAPPAAPSGTPPGALTSFAALPGWAARDLRPALRAFRASCAAGGGSVAPSPTAAPVPGALRAACRAVAPNGATIDAAAARGFFERHFEPRLVSADAFFTGYFEPVVDGALTPSTDFPVPLYATPPDLVRVERGRAWPGLDLALTAARRLPDGRLVPMPDRAAIEAGALRSPPIVYLRDRVDAYVVQVQGSARIKLTDGSLRRLVFAGRNGYPYTSIGKLLVERLHVPPSAMGMARLVDWIRAHGQGPGQAGAQLMQQNRSYIFFRFDDALPAEAGPIGGEGASLAALTSLAIDRAAWPYGLPFYVDADLPQPEGSGPEPFRRLMIGQDTGSAIVGAARGDIFYGTGPAAGQSAGAIHHHGALYVLWPRDEARAP